MVSVSSLNPFHFRYLTLIVIFCGIIGSAVMFVIGAIKTFLACVVLVLGQESAGISLIPDLLGPDTASMLLLVEAIDNFLFGIVFLLFSAGIYTLFIRSCEDEENAKCPSWMHVSNISQLKSQLAQVIIIMLFVVFLEKIVLIEENTPLDWNMLVLPLAILALSIALKCMHTNH